MSVKSRKISNIIFKLMTINIILLISIITLFNISYYIFPISNDYIVTLDTIIALGFTSKYILQVRYGFSDLKLDIKASKINFEKNFIFSLLIMLIVGLVLFFYKKLMIILGVNNTNYIEVTTDILVGVVIFAPFIEEIFFRRIIYTYIMNNIKYEKINKYIFLICSTIMFSSVHFSSIYKIISVIPIGLGLSIIFLYTKNFVYTWIMHFIYNLTMIFDITKFELNIYRKLPIYLEDVFLLYPFIRFIIIVSIILILFIVMCKIYKSVLHKISL